MVRREQVDILVECLVEARSRCEGVREGWRLDDMTE